MNSVISGGVPSAPAPIPFNIESAKQGAPVETRNGLPVEIFAYDLKHSSGPAVIGRILGAPVDRVHTWAHDGHSTRGLREYGLVMTRVPEVPAAAVPTESYDERLLRLLREEQKELRENDRAPFTWGMSSPVMEQWRKRTKARMTFWETFTGYPGTTVKFLVDAANKYDVPLKSMFPKTYRAAPLEAGVPTQS